MSYTRLKVHHLNCACIQGGLPPEILLMPRIGHTLGHSGVAVQADSRWLLHAGDAYFDPREVHQPRRERAFRLGLFQAAVQTNRAQHLWNQGRLRSLIAEHPEVGVFSAHNSFEFPRPDDPRGRLTGQQAI